MSEMLEATCEGGKVKVKAGEIPNCKILSDGKAASSGFVFLEEGSKVYVAIPVDSLKLIIDLCVSLADKVGSGVAASNGGGAIAPTLAADMQAVIQQFNQLKDNLQ